MEDLKLNSVQRAAYTLIKKDLQYLYTVFKNIRPEESNYIPSMMPYVGVVIDGSEDWVKAINNSNKCKLAIPLFNEAERIFYEEIRNCIKLWHQDYKKIYRLLGDIYKKSDNYFGSICKPIAKVLQLYDIYGVDTINGAICGNTILCHYYSPFFSLDGNNNEYIKAMAQIGGSYIALFEATKELEVNGTLKFDIRDYGGFIKSPVGNPYSDCFVLLSILCQINFLLYGVERWIKDEIPTKLRFGYLLYFSLCHILPQLNKKLCICLKLDEKWKSVKFRNAMAHYKLGVVLKESELMHDDLMFGLTNKIFGENYFTVKNEVYYELERLAKQIGKCINLPNDMVYIE